MIVAILQNYKKSSIQINNQIQTLKLNQIKSNITISNNLINQSLVTNQTLNPHPSAKHIINHNTHNPIIITHQAMQLQQPTTYHINQTHNLAIQNIVSNQQPKHIMFHKLEHIRILYRQGQQHRFLTGLVVAGRNFIKIYALFSNLVYEELASYNIYQDIEAISSWEKTIVIQTRQKIVGLIYEDSMLKNAFMLSLQFLPLNRNDACHCAFDRLGHIFAVYVKGFLLLCFSDALIAKYKTKPQYRQFSQIVNEDVKWNRPQKTYIQQIIKIRISDFQLSRLENMNICNQSLYFIGLKNLQKPTQANQFSQQSFYQIQCQSFFISHDNNKIMSFLAKKDPQVRQMIPYVYNKQMQCLFLKQDSIYVQVGREMVLVDELGTENYQIVHRNNTDYFSLWVRVGNVIRTYYRNGNSFVKGAIELKFYCESILLKEELGIGQGTIVYASETRVGMLRVDLGFGKRAVGQSGKNGNEIEEEISLSDRSGVIMHRSLGNLVDFQFWKNSILIIESKFSMEESGEVEVRSKLYQMRRSLTTDPKPHITHQKKNFLQALLTENKLKSIKSLRFRLSFDTPESDNIIVTQTHSFNKRYSFYRQLFNQGNRQLTSKQNGFEKVLEDVAWYFVTSYKQKQLLVMVNDRNEMWVEVEGQERKEDKEKRVLAGLTVRSQKQSLNVFCVENYLLYQLECQENLKLRVCEVFTGQSFDIEVQLGSKDTMVRMFLSKKRQSSRKKDKSSLVFQLTIILSNQLRVYQLYPQTRTLTLSYTTSNISRGLSHLSNWLNFDTSHNNLQKDKLRSITCPEYILNQYHPTTKQLYIKNVYIYSYNTLELMFLVNSEDELMVYRKTLSFLNEIGYVYRRVVVPLNVVKAFRGGEEIGELGEGMVRVGTVLCCQGEMLEHNLSHLSYFQMDAALWVVEKDRIRMVDLKPLAGSNQALFRQQTRKDSKDFATTAQFSNKGNTLQQNIEIMSNFILTPTRTMMRKQLLGLQLSSDYIILYSKTGFQVLNSKDMKLLWICNLSNQNPQRKQVIINIKAFEHYIALSYYDYIQDETTEFKSIKFKFRVYSVLAKKKILQKPKTTDQPILHVRAISADKILLATSSTLFIYLIKGEKALEPIRTRIFSKRFGLGAFSYIPQVIDQKLKIHKPCYMMCGNQYGGLSFYVGRWMENDNLREMWFEKLRAHVRNVQLFHYGQQLKALVSDQDCNLIVINLKPDTQQQPARAEKLADINVGSKSNVFRIRHQQDRKIYASFQDGTIKSISAIKLDNPEISLIDFQQQAFCKQIPFIGGFNLRTSSLLTQKYRTYKYVSRGNVLDCQILEEFFAMSSNLKEYILQKSELKVQQLKAVIRSI